ncbi:hypothetical protein FACS1894208_11790 [Clostridia bacterium]|nr:hypothetical protein FACS1894208_11790 [Clostridia bacterium]
MTIEPVNTYANDIKAQNQVLAEANIEDVVTAITFAERLDFNETEAFIEQYGIEDPQLHARGVMSDGTRVSILTRTDRGLEETMTILLQQAEEDGFDLIGITGMNARVDSEKILEIQDDSIVYLADTSGDRFFKGQTNSDGMARNYIEAPYKMTRGYYWSTHQETDTSEGTGLSKALSATTSSLTGKGCIHIRFKLLQINN